MDTNQQGLFYSYNFTVQESTSLDIEVAVDPEMLGKVFEELVTGRHESGSYYTPRPVVSFMCREILKDHLADRTTASKKAIASLIDNHLVENLTEIHAREIAEVFDRLKAVDPACGSGAYLLGLLQELIAVRRALQSEKLVADSQFLYALKLQIISSNLYGVDIDPFATEITKLRLWLSLAVEAEEPVPLPNLDFKIEIGDSLLGPCEEMQDDLFGTALRDRALHLVKLKDEYITARGESKLEIRADIENEEEEITKEMRHLRGDGVVDWHIHFADVFVKNGGFDVVLANPPYVNMVQMESLDSTYRDSLRRRYRSATRGFDLFVPFIERGVHLLAPEGKMAYITPNKLLSAEYAKDLRDYLRETVTLRSLTDLSHVPVFSASVYPVITIAKKTTAQDAAMVAIFMADATSQDKVTIRFSHSAPLAIADADENRWSVLMNTDAHRLLPALQCQIRLSDIADVFGAATVSEAYAWKKAVVDEGKSLYDSNPARYRPFIVSGNIRPFFHTWLTAGVRYIKQRYNTPVLDLQHPAITERRRMQIRSQKVIVSGMSKRPTCVWDSEGVAAGKSTVIVIPKMVKDGPFIAVLLNSSLMANLYHAMFGSLSLAGGYMRFGPPQIKALPIPMVSDAEKEELIALVESNEVRDQDANDDQSRIDDYVERLYLQGDSQNIG